MVVIFTYTNKISDCAVLSLTVTHGNVCSLYMAGQWVFHFNKTHHHDITEILSVITQLYYEKKV
jgi:hypothetical protein